MASSNTGGTASYSTVVQVVGINPVTVTNTSTLLFQNSVTSSPNTGGSQTITCWDRLNGGPLKDAPIRADENSGRVGVYSTIGWVDVLQNVAPGSYIAQLVCWVNGGTGTGDYTLGPARLVVRAVG